MKILASFLCLLAGAAYAEPQTGSATAKDACSVANTGNNNIFTITCGIGKQQGDALLKIMNKILANHLDPDAVMAKLNEILHAVNPNAPKITYTFDGSERLESPGRSINPFSANRCSSSTILGYPTLQPLQLRSENPEKRV